MKNKTYDILRWAQDIVPIVGTLITTLMALYGCGEHAVAVAGGTITAITAMLVSIVRLAKKYYDEEGKTDD